ncbi:NAD(P)/FAD-dependent oxidoreductase [Bordetella flabilis]|uniref:FAD-dependent oxidoreductase n=1 Tax=Bordetella flabilis TaxID=463014 RepID=A0A193G7K5_9BORD|nr:FAD-dependent oxidoreductase [Bordetella flabilis]ANN75962.1 FAD-dependent oxidoreductase [Bordetella flabilis]
MPGGDRGAFDGVLDALVVGGGLVGSAIAYGLRGAFERVAVLDEGDVAWRASRGNFGLVWVQSKGIGMAAYSRWTVESAGLWPAFAARLLDQTGIDVRLEQPGGLTPLMSEGEIEARVSAMRRLHAQPGMPKYEWKLLDRYETAQALPGVGPDVQGAIWSERDGILNPLKLLLALHTAFARMGVHYLPRTPAQSVSHEGMHGDLQGVLREPSPASHAPHGGHGSHGGGLFRVATPRGELRARRLVIAAGLANQALAAQVGLDVPVRPQRGQIMVLERTRRHLPLPCVTLRQTDEGTWLVGDSQEEAGFDDASLGLPVLATLADRAVRTLPALRDVRVVRTWSALRVMARDGFPVYQESTRCPGAFVATCHSGVTLAAAHALSLAPRIAAGALDDAFLPFSTDRFDVQTT